MSYLEEWCKPTEEWHGQEQLDEIQRQGVTQLQLQQDPASGDPSQWQSSVASTGVWTDEALMDHYPVDNIRDRTNCELHQSMKNIHEGGGRLCFTL
jgi:hypothetical protein